MGGGGTEGQHSALVVAAVVAIHCDGYSNQLDARFILGLIN
jgi:hypothetical protein